MDPTWESDCGTVKLWLADCLDVMKTWPDGAVDAVVTDPPYGIDYQSARRIDRSTWKPKIANDKSPAVEWIELVKHARVCLCFCRWDVAEVFRSSLQNVKAQIIWDRVSHGMGDLNGSPAPVHDIIWFCAQDGYRFPGVRPKSVVRHMRIDGMRLCHPNEKPVSLMVDLVSSYTHHADSIADPFMGSGTTGVAAARLGRSFWGVELDPKYFEIAKRRIQDELKRNSFLEPAPSRQKQMMLDEVTN